MPSDPPSPNFVTAMMWRFAGQNRIKFLTPRGDHDVPINIQPDGAWLVLRQHLEHLRQRAIG